MSRAHRSFRTDENQTVQKGEHKETCISVVETETTVGKNVFEKYFVFSLPRVLPKIIEEWPQIDARVNHLVVTMCCLR